MLQVGGADEQVGIELRIQQTVRRQGVGANIDAVEDVGGQVLRQVVAARQVVDRVGEDVHALAEQVAVVAGAEERQHQEPAFAHAPVAQGLAEVLVVLDQADPVADVDQSADTPDAVDHEAPGIGRALAELGLEEIVDDGGRIDQVGEEIGDAFARPARGDGDIALGRRLQHVLVGLGVEAPHRPVDRFERIGRIVRRVVGATSQQYGDGDGAATMQSAHTNSLFEMQNLVEAEEPGELHDLLVGAADAQILAPGLAAPA